MDFNHNRFLGPSNPLLRLPTRVYKSSSLQVLHLNLSAWRSVLEKEIALLLEKKALLPLPPRSTGPGFISTCFLAPKKLNQWWLIINLRPLNAFIRPKRFLMETLRTVLVPDMCHANTQSFIVLVSVCISLDLRNLSNVITIRQIWSIELCTCIKQSNTICMECTV